jgi:hypothetical protein
MRIKYFFKLLFLILSLQSFGQTVKMFSKTVNVFVVTDMYLNPIEQATKVNARADFYWDKTTNSGVVKVTDLAHGKVYKYPVNQLYTGVAKGLKIYYFQTSDGKEKISVSKEENGFAFAHYTDKTITVYGNE